jgi:hypothetical protein
VSVQLSPLIADYDIEGVYYGGGIEKILAQLKEIKRRIEDGEPIAGLNLSLSVKLNRSELDFARLKDIFSIDTSPENIRYDSKGIRRALSLSTDFKTQWEIVRTLDEICQRIPVFVAATNNGKDSFNLLSLANGIHTIGATNAIGEIVDFSPEHSLVSGNSQGVINIIEIYDGKSMVGFDINGDGKPEVLSSEVTPGIQPAKIFSNKPINDFLYNDPCVPSQFPGSFSRWKFIHGLPLSKLLKIDDFKGLSKKDMFGRGSNPEFYGDYAYFKLKYGENLSHKDEFSTFIFRANELGIISYDPDKSGRPNTIGQLSGTSYASPRALANYLRFGTIF